MKKEKKNECEKKNGANETFKKQIEIEIVDDFRFVSIYLYLYLSSSQYKLQYFRDHKLSTKTIFFYLFIYKQEMYSKLKSKRVKNVKM